MNKASVHKISFRLLAGALLLLPILLIAFKETWMLERALATFEVFAEKASSIMKTYAGEESYASTLLSRTGDIIGFPDWVNSIDFEAFFEGVKTYFFLFINGTNALLFLADTTDVLVALSRWLLILTMAAVMLIIVMVSFLSENRLDYRDKSLPRRAFAKYEEGPKRKAKAYLRQFLEWYKKSPWLYASAFFYLTLMGIPLIAIDILGEYFYFFTAFDLVSLADTLIVDILTLLGGFFVFPLWMRAIAIYLAFRLYSFHKARKLIEEKLIPEDEKMVENDTGVFTLILGKMRGGKTTLATAMARVLNTVYHKNAFDNMNRVCMMFPDFPFAALEHLIVEMASKRRLLNINQCAGLAYKLYEKGQQNPLALFGYDLSKGKTSFFDGAITITLKDALAIYAESYFIYFQPGNLIASNYPIRTDDIRKDKGHLILYDSNYFNRDNRKLWEFSSLSHILVFDSLRFGKKVDKRNPYKDTAGPMIAVATEFGKEYGNMVTNQSYSSSDENANPKNDLLDYSLKLGGHLANIWHTNFFKFIADEQRSGSLSSNLVSVAQTVFTADPKNQKEKMAVKLLWLEPIILEAIVKLRDAFFKKYRYEREDDTLTMTLINRMAGFAYKISTFLYMRYCYKSVSLPSCTANTTGDLIEGDSKRFYIINFVDYAYRFESACMKDFLNASKANAEKGFFDIPTYQGLMPNKQEWDAQGSYLVMDLEDPGGRYKSKKAPKRLKKASGGKPSPEASLPRRGRKRR